MKIYYKAEGKWRPWFCKFANEINHLNDLIKQGMIEEFKIVEDTDESLS